MTNHQSGRTLQRHRTSLPAAAVLGAAREFFSRGSGIYSAFLDKEGPNWVNLRGQGGEEIALAAHEENGVTEVTGSSYMFDAQVALFLSSLPPAAEQGAAS